MKRFAKFCIQASVPLAVALLICSSVNAQVAPDLKDYQPNASSAKQLTQAQLKVKNAQNAVGRLESRVNDSIASLSKSQASLLKQHKEEIKLGISPNSYPEIVRNLQTHRVELMIELAGLNAKQERLLKATKERKEAAEKTFEIYLKQKANYDKLLAIDEAAALKVDAQLAKSKSDYESLNARGTLEHELLLELSLEKAEQSARLEKVETLVANFAKAGEMLAKRDQISREIQVNEEQLAKFRSDLLKRSDDLYAAQQFLQQLEESPEEF